MPNIIFKEKEYEIIKHEEGLAPYAIFKRGKQVSKWYCTMGWTSNKLKQLIKKGEQDANIKTNKKI